MMANENYELTPAAWLYSASSDLSLYSREDPSNLVPLLNARKKIDRALAILGQVGHREEKNGLSEVVE